MLHKKIAPITYGVVLAAFTAYVLLDTFALQKKYQENTVQMNTTLFTTAITAAQTETETNTRTTQTTADTETADENAVSATQTENSYQDENIAITITEYTVCDTAVYVADVQLSSAEYLKTAFAEDSYGKNITEKTSEIAAAHDAILAINGDYYGAQESGYVIRNGILYREVGDSDTDVLCIYADGSFSITNSAEQSASKLLEQGVWQAFSFGPALLVDGQFMVDSNTEVGKSKASNPRTAIGILEPLHYLFVVSDGRTEESAGLSLYELAEFMQSLGAETAYNLDGGGSSTMYFQGEVINHPTTDGDHIKERSVSDIVYIG